MDALNPAKRRAAQRPTPQRVYVKVTSEFDATGYMQPRAITWADGRTFAIDAVRDFRPAGTLGCDCRGDCYTVVIRGEDEAARGVVAVKDLRRGEQFDVVETELAATLQVEREQLRTQGLQA